MTFEQASKLPRSEKATLVTIQSEQFAKLFMLYSGNIYYRDVDFFVYSVKQFGVSLESVESIDLIASGSYFYDIQNKRLYLNIIGDDDPKTTEISIIYTHFFSNKPLNLPYDLLNGQAVEWLPYINSISSIGQRLDDLSTGIVLESSSEISLLNNGLFDSIYDTHIFENKAVNFYIWFPVTAISEKRKIFEGYIESKDYAPNVVNFKVKDFIFRFRDKLNLPLFSDLDGSLPDSLIGTPKRRIYGKIKQLKCASVDSLLDGYAGTGTITIDTSSSVVAGTASGEYVSNDLTGTVSGTSSSRTVTGTGTSFLTQVSPNQKIRITNGLATYTYKVFAVASNTSLTLTSDIDVSFSSFTAKNLSSGNKSVYGVGTSFLSQLQQGSSVKFSNGITDIEMKVEYIVSDTELTMTDFIPASFSAYNITNTDQKAVKLVGTGTQFISELCSGDTIKFTIDENEIKGTIDFISSNTLALLSDEITTSIIAKPFLIEPNIKFYNTNREWHVAGHKLREPTTTISAVVANNRFILDSTEDIFNGDQVLINGNLVSVRRISENELVTQNAIYPLPIVGDTVKKLPIQNVFFGLKEFIYSRDWVYLNGSSDSKIIFNANAEFNNTEEKMLGVSVSFVNGSRSIITSSIVDFRSILKPRDFIRKNSNVSGENTYFEIIDVKEQEIVLKIPFSGSTETTLAYRKNVEYITDGSLITCNCMGYEKDSLWLKTPADCVRHIILNDAGFLSVNEASFTQAKADCDFIVSMVIPERIEGEQPSIRDTITKINESVFGSISGNSSQEISYNILNSVKPADTEIIRDDDIISFASDSVTNIYNEISVTYRPFVDHATGDNAFEIFEYNSAFVDKFVGIKNKLVKKLYLYESDKAEIIAQRFALFNSLSNTKITLKSKMNLFTKSLNDKIFLSLDRLFKRFGGGDNMRIGVVTETRKGQTNVEIVLSDLGNVFNRVPSIAPDSSNNYSSASNDEKIRWGYVVDDYMLTPNPSSEENLGNNIIG